MDDLDLMCFHCFGTGQIYRLTDITFDFDNDTIINKPPHFVECTACKGTGKKQNITESEG